MERIFRAAPASWSAESSTESAAGGYKRAALALENIGIGTESASKGHKRAALITARQKQGREKGIEDMKDGQR